MPSSDARECDCAEVFPSVFEPQSQSKLLTAGKRTPLRLQSVSSQPHTHEVNTTYLFRRPHAFDADYCERARTHSSACLHLHSPTSSRSDHGFATGPSLCRSGTSTTPATASSDYCAYTDLLHADRPWIATSSSATVCAAFADSLTSIVPMT